MTLYIINFLLFFFIYSILMRLAIKIKFVDIANSRKRHKGEIPLIGGLIIVCTIFIYYFFNHKIYVDTSISIILFSSLIIFFIGLLDDFLDVRPYLRLVFQLIAVLIVVGNNLSITKIGNLPFSLFVENYGYILTIFSVIVLINAYNFIDGLMEIVVLISYFQYYLFYLYSYNLLTVSLSLFLQLLALNAFFCINIYLILKSFFRR